VDTPKAVTHVSLCAGYGGIDLGLKRAIPSLRTVAFSEIEAFACANLVSKMESGQLDPAPIWTDLKTFPWGYFRGVVDILSGGYPCQPFSTSGRRRGERDPRHLWPFIADGIAAMRPRVCFFENVEGHITLGLSDVIEDLATMGYRTTWGIFSAAEVGAPHSRKRVFILAHRNDNRCMRHGSRAASFQDQNQSLNGISGKDGSLADCQRTRLEGFGVQPGNEDESEFRHGGSPEWPSRPGEQQHPWEPPRITQPPLGGDPNGTSGGLDYAQLCVSYDNRTDELRLLGNGVVPATAHKAFVTLLQELK